MTDYDKNAENREFYELEQRILAREKSAKRAESDPKPHQSNGLLVSVPRDPYFDHRNEGNC